MPSFFFHIIFDLNPPLLPGTRLQSIHSKESFEHGVTDTTEPQPRDCLSPASSNLSSDASGAATSLQALSNDWRIEKLYTQDIIMAPAGTSDKTGGQLTRHVPTGVSPGSSGPATKGRYELIDAEEKDIGWGVIRLFRDFEETPGLYEESASNRNPKGGRHTTRKENEPPFRDEECTTLCILAVPSYLTPSDFLGFVGERTREEVSHFRMIRTERGNRYMVLMKFRNGKKAREWRKEWNGKVFDGMEVTFYIPSTIAKLM